MMLDHAIEALGRMARASAAGLGGTALLLDVDDRRNADLLASQGYDVIALGDPADHPRTAIHWTLDRLPFMPHMQRLGIACDLILLDRAWAAVRPNDRARAFRILATLLKPAGRLVLVARQPGEIREMESLAREYGMSVLSGTVPEGAGVMVMAPPDDGAGALPLLRGIILNNDKASTYKLALLRAVARIADAASGAAVPHETEDSVALPLGLVALHWVRQYLPLVAAGLPQLPGNRGPARLGFAKAGFCALLGLGVPAQDLRIGQNFEGDRAHALAAALSEARRTITDMPARFTHSANGVRVFTAAPASPPRLRGALMLDLPTLHAHGTLSVPGPVWRTLQRLGAWVEPVVVAEWARMIGRYARTMGVEVRLGQAEQALSWLDPARDTALARAAIVRLTGEGRKVRCAWTGVRLAAGFEGPDIDHCLPWCASPCGDLWNLLPASRQVNRAQKAGRLPSAAVLSGARPRVLAWWEEAWLTQPALARRFDIEASAALPVKPGAILDDVFAGVQWRRLRLRQDQQIREWTGAILEAAPQ